MSADAKPARESDPSAGGAAAAAGLRVVLLTPRRGANVGAVCRAIKNMGAGGLAVVGGDFDAGEASRTAVHARDVFDARHDAASFDEAVGSSRFVIGTTSRQGPWQIPVRSIDEVFAEVRRRGLAAHEIALVFGPEDRGLSNEELARCHRLAYVPTAGAYDSLNLAQAAVVCLYEWLRSGPVAAAAPIQGDVAPASTRMQTDALEDLRDVLAEIGFLDGDQADRVMATIASMLTRAGLDEREVSILRGMSRQIRWAARRNSHRE